MYQLRKYSKNILNNLGYSRARGNQAFNTDETQHTLNFQQATNVSFIQKLVSIMKLLPRGATRMARGGIRLVHGHTKSTLITYFSGMKIDPKYAFLHAFFLICQSCPFQNVST